MTAFSNLRAGAFALACVLVSHHGVVLAMDEHAEQAADPDVSQTDFAVDGATASIAMPCAEPAAGPSGGDGFQSSVCIVGDRMFVFAIAADGSGGGPMISDFDAAYVEIETSPDTVSIEQAEVGGRRTMQATRGPDPDFGFMQAIELREDAVVYTIAMSRPGMTEPLSQEDKAAMRMFVESLEITP